MSGEPIRIIEITGKTKDDAIMDGLKQLGLTIEEVSIKIIQEGSRGLFGIGAKPYVVRLTENRETPIIEEKITQKAPPSKSPSAYEEFVFAPYILGESDCEAANFLSGLLERMDLEAEISFSETPDVVRLRLKSDYMGILIGHRGETLNALQYLTNLSVNRHSDQYKRVYLDMENYRNKRESTLINLAQKAAKEVLKTGDTITLEPMNPYERRIFHASLQEIDGITTYSEGEEPERYIVIAPKGDH